LAASAAALSPSQLIPLADLTSQAVWNARADPLAKFEYYEASQAARFLRQDVGIAGTIVILDRMRQGSSFDAAFLTVTGNTSDSLCLWLPGAAQSERRVISGGCARERHAGPGRR